MPRHQVPLDHQIRASEHRTVASKVFENREFEVIDGCRVLATVIGSDVGSESFLRNLTREQSKLLVEIAEHAKISPQSAHKSFASVVQYKLTVIIRINRNWQSLLDKTGSIMCIDLLNMLDNPFFNRKFREIFT